MQEIGSHTHHFVRLNLTARADITWWYLFVGRVEWDISTVGPRLTEAQSGGVY